MSFEIEFEHFSEKLAENVIVSVDFHFTKPYANAESDWDARTDVVIESIGVWFNGEDLSSDIDIDDALVYSEISAFIRNGEIGRAFDEETYL